MNVTNPISAMCLQECWLGDAVNVSMLNPIRSGGGL